MECLELVSGFYLVQRHKPEQTKLLLFSSALEESWEVFAYRDENLL